MSAEKQSAEGQSEHGTLPPSALAGSSPTPSEYQSLAQAVQAQARAIELLVAQNTMLLALVTQAGEQDQDEVDDAGTGGFDLSGNRIKVT
ncbi:hypothetical protein LVB77_14635 [Lysobacter sp. 5GHs7-4]|uniref:hypothetical protein n=1 Tax=Lysobacter sp. 5GHs7-4 TaxID=2904253 RepID=UPI001E46DDA3|nr:hypothetical protein [Lysobacter sp. 5GHs7-4]UHQ21903.1 hypothetical protein LVB77_14635 [Lysobacter sp. 5GHs7-4]